jgi:hypothetical protein
LAWLERSMCCRPVEYIYIHEWTEPYVEPVFESSWDLGVRSATSTTYGGMIRHGLRRALCADRGPMSIVSYLDYENVVYLATNIFHVFASAVLYLLRL